MMKLVALLRFSALCIVAGTTILSTFSCVREESAPEEPLPVGDFRYIGGIAPSAYPAAKSTMATYSNGTKTHLDPEDKVTVKWDKGDNVSAFFKDKADKDKHTATNESDDPDKGRFYFPNVKYTYAYYPGEREATADGNALTITGAFPTEQQYFDGGFDCGVNPMVADASPVKEWTFFNAGALVSFALSVPENEADIHISKITLTDNNPGTESDKYLFTTGSSGKAVIAVNGESTATSVISGSNSVSLNGDMVISKNQKLFYAVVAPGTYGSETVGNGIKLELTRTDGAVATYTNDHELTLGRNQNLIVARIVVDKNKFVQKGQGLPASWYASNYTDRTASKDPLYSLDNPSAYLYPYTSNVGSGIVHTGGKMRCKLNAANMDDIVSYRFAVPDVTLQAGKRVVLKLKGFAHNSSNYIKPTATLYCGSTAISAPIDISDGDHDYVFELTSPISDSPLEVQIDCTRKADRDSQFDFTSAEIELYTNIDATWSSTVGARTADIGNTSSTISCEGATLQAKGESSSPGLRVVDNSTNAYTVTINVPSTSIPAGTIVRMTSAFSVESGTGFNLYVDCPSGGCENSYTYYNLQDYNSGATLREYDFLMKEDVEGDFDIKLTRTKTAGTHLNLVRQKDLIISTVSRNVTKFEFNNSSETLAVGASMTLVPLTNPGETNLASSWSSSDPGIVSVDANGNVEALHDGTTVITAVSLDGTCTATCTLTVNPSSNVAKIKETGVQYSTLQAAHNAAAEGQTIVLLNNNTATQTLFYTNGKNLDLSGYNSTGTLIFYSLDNKTSSIYNGSGLIGTLSRLQGFNSDVSEYHGGTINLHDITIETIATGHTIYHIGNNVEVSTITRTCMTSEGGTDGSHPIYIEGENARVAAINDNNDNGKLQAVYISGGYFTQAVYNRIAVASNNIHVVGGEIQHIDNTPYPGYDYKYIPYIAPESVTFDNTDERIEAIGGTLQLSAVVLPSTATQDLEWESSAPAVATVDANGLVTAKSTGIARITATSIAAPDKFAECYVTVGTSIVARIEATGYTSLDGAATAFKSGDEITLLKDLNGSYVETVFSNKNYKINLNDHVASNAAITFDFLSGYTSEVYGGGPLLNLSGYNGTDSETGTIKIHDLDITNLRSGRMIWEIGENCVIEDIKREPSTISPESGLINIVGETVRVGDISGDSKFPVRISGGYFTETAYGKITDASKNITIEGGTVQQISDSPYPGYNYKFVPFEDGNERMREIDNGSGGFTNADF